MEPQAASAAHMLDDHARCTTTSWRVGDLDVVLRTKVGVRGYPGVDGALVALGEALRRGRVTPPQGAGATIRALDLTGAPGAMPAWAAAAGVAAGGGADWLVASSSAAVLAAAREGLAAAARAGVRATAIAALPWEAAGPFDWIVWRPPADRGVRRVRAELAAVAARWRPAGRRCCCSTRTRGRSAASARRPNASSRSRRWRARPDGA
jgi:hypothetical protein